MHASIDSANLFATFRARKPISHRGLADAVPANVPAVTLAVVDVVRDGAGADCAGVGHGRTSGALVVTTRALIPETSISPHRKSRDQQRNADQGHGREYADCNEHERHEWRFHCDHH